MRDDILAKKELILKWISEELPKCEISKRLRCKHDTLNSYLSKMGIEYAGQKAKKGQQKGPNKYTSASKYLAKNGPTIHSHKLKLKLIKDGIKDDKCEVCGNSQWLNKKIPLELHHKDGDHYNNELSNLQILCPNCHAILANNSGAATGSYTKK